MLEGPVAVTFQNSEKGMVGRYGKVPDDEIRFSIRIEITNRKGPRTVVRACMIVDRLLESAIAIAKDYTDLSVRTRTICYVELAVAVEIVDHEWHAKATTQSRLFDRLGTTVRGF